MEPCGKSWHRWAIWSGLGGLLVALVILLSLGGESRPVQTTATPAEPKREEPPPRGSQVPAGTYATEPRSDFSLRKGSNGAPIFREAWTLLQELTERQKAIIAGAARNVLSGETAQLLEDLEPVFALMRKGLAADYRDWEWNLNGNEAEKPNNLADVFVWRAKVTYGGNMASALADLVASEDMGIFRQSVGTSVMQVGVPRPSLDLLSKILEEQILPEDTPNLGPLTSTVFRDAAFESEFLPTLDRARELLLAQDLTHFYTKSVADGRKWSDPDEMRSAIDRSFDIGREIVKNFSDERLFGELTKQLDAVMGHDVAHGADQMRLTFMETQSMRAMLGAGVAIQNGRRAPVDPVTGQPFQLTEERDHFILKTPPGSRFTDLARKFAR